MALYDEYREELASINRLCEQYAITGDVLNLKQTMKITGWCGNTVRRHIRFGGQKGTPCITRSQLARQLTDLAQYRIVEPA